MPLVFSPDAPPEGAELVRGALQKIGPEFFRTESGIKPRQLGVVPKPIRMYALRYHGPESIASTALPETGGNPVPGSWLYFVVDYVSQNEPHGLTPIGVVQLDHEGANLTGWEESPWVVGRVSAGDGYRHWGERLDQMASSIKYSPFEPRLFRVPALGVSAIWLHQGNGAHDRFGPLTFGGAAASTTAHDDVLRTPSGRVLESSMGATDFLGELRSLARATPIDDDATLPAKEFLKGGEQYAGYI